MIAQSDILTYLKDHKSQFQRDFKITKLGLFGSYASNSATDASDIDLIVEFEPETDDLFGKKEVIRQLLKTRFNKNVDVCREKYLKPFVRNKILASAIYV